MSTTLHATATVPASPRPPAARREAADPQRPPDRSRTDDDLLAALSAGEQAAWAPLIARHQRLLLFIARQHGLSGDDAADVVQEAWVRLWSHLDAVRDGERLAGWLATTVRRECIARRRQAWRESPTWDGAELRPDVPDDDDTERRWADAELARRLRVAIGTLTGRERAVVELLLEPEPVTYAEISRRLAMPIGAIGPVRGRALRRLRTALDSDGAVPTAAVLAIRSRQRALLPAERTGDARTDLT